MARGPQGANVAPRRAEIPGHPADRPEPSPPSKMERLGSGLSDTAKKVLAATGATAAAGGAAGLGARALMRREAAKRAAEAERIAARVSPAMRRSGEGIDDAMKQARIEMAREPQMERARALSAAERKAPAMQGDKAKASPRARTRDEEDVEFKHGGKVKTYAKGGSVRGAGCETRTKKTRFV